MTRQWHRRIACTLTLAALAGQPIGAALLFIEPGSSATGDLAFFTQTVGAVASVVGGGQTPSRSIQLSTGSPAVAASVLYTASWGSAGRMTYYMQRSATAAAISDVFYVEEKPLAGNRMVFRVQEQTTGILRIKPVGVGATNGTTVLATNTLYRLDVSWVITSTTVFTINLYLNGILEASAVNTGTLTAWSEMNGGSNVVWVLSDTAGASVTMNISDLVVDGVNDASDLGDLRVTAKRPAANNTNQFDTAIGANPATRWTNVNEVPTNTANGWTQTAIADTQENYTLEGASVGDVNMAPFAVLGRAAWLWFAETLAAAGQGPALMDNGTETRLLKYGTLPTLFSLLTTTSAYPSNVAGIGMRSANDVLTGPDFLYDCGTIIVYDAGHPKTLMTLGIR